MLGGGEIVFVCVVLCVCFLCVLYNIVVVVVVAFVRGSRFGALKRVGGGGCRWWWWRICVMVWMVLSSLGYEKCGVGCSMFQMVVVVVVVSEIVVVMVPNDSGGGGGV